MAKKELPSGRAIFDPLAGTPVAKEVEPSIAAQESLSAMTHDGENICPKCAGTMSDALSFNNVPVFFCDSCRVSNPKRV